MTEIKEIVLKTPEEIENEAADMVRRRYNSLVEATLDLEKRNKILLNEIAAMTVRLENAQRNVNINKKIVQDALLGQNKIKDEFAAEIDILRKKLNSVKEAAK